MRSIRPLVYGVIYLSALVLGLLVLVIPENPIFYRKVKVEKSELVPFEGNFQYSLHINTFLFDRETMRVYEGGTALENVLPENLPNAGHSKFAVGLVKNDSILVLIAPENGSSGDFLIEIRPYFISTNRAGNLLVVLLLWLAALIWSVLIDPEKRKVLFSSPIGILKIWNEFFDRTKQQNKSPLKLELTRQLACYVRIWPVVTITILSAYLYVFMEWLFWITRRSFMSDISFGQQIIIFLAVGLVVTLFSMLVLLIIFLISRAFKNLKPGILPYLFALPSAVTLACLGLILVDNFTYTIFHFAATDSRSLIRVFYALAFSVFFASMMRYLAKKVQRKVSRIYLYPAIALAFVSLLVIGFSLRLPSRNEVSANAEKATGQRPNIIILGSDGMEADHMSVYGYERDTTPFLRELSKTSLVSLNHFTNAAHTTGSDTALLTGRSAFATRVLFPPDILKGWDSFHHLPGILQENGYYTIQLGVTYFIDANEVNFQRAFDEVNCSKNPNGGFSDWVAELGYDNEVYFLSTTRDRILDRLAHIFFIKDVEKPIDLIRHFATYHLNDEKRLDCLYQNLEEAKQTGRPFFAHVHLMETHGPYFVPEIRHFSMDKEQPERWMTDFYDDTIYTFDRRVEKLVAVLKDSGLYENTLLIVYTDHGQRSETNHRLPLILHFPQDSYAGEITVPTQNLDVAPTILDLLDVSQPEWMEGNSILSNLDPKRLVIAGGTDYVEGASAMGNINQEILKPPFYQFTKLSVIQCQHWFTFHLNDKLLERGEVNNFVNPCQANMVSSQGEIESQVSDWLISMGYQLPENWEESLVASSE